MAKPGTDAATAHAKVGALAAVSRLDAEGRRARTAPAQAARWRKYEDQVDPDGVLDPAERRTRARYAMRADLARASLKAALARREAAKLAEALGGTQ
ncbi:MAG TPA: hypothetical protein VHA75_08060 [Rugosimonospora sp.]|nr:hypothetical protein [Rugosimonospora sp.]